jgi:Tfp pilus assembly protein FimT
MTPTSYSNRKTIAGISLIEMMVAVVVLGVVAAIMLPNVQAVKKSRDAKALISNIVNFTQDAEAQAVKLKMPVEIQVVGATLIMEQEPLDGSAATQIKSLDLGSLQVVSAQLNGQDENVGSWAWQAYPDGTTDRGALGISDGTQSRALVISQAGDVTWLNSQPPLATDDTWQAGQLAQRAD